MPKQTKIDPLTEIEHNQKQLRDNIEESKKLVEETQALLQQVKKDQASSSK